jgi:SAM-dependent methyltransferase
MPHDRYEGFAERYDLDFAHAEPEPAQVDFFRRLFAEHGVRSVLDCACGTGRHLLLFHSLGCKVSGSDLSRAMLDRARQNLAGRGIQVALQEADYCELPWHFRRRFDAVTCLNSIGYMAGDSQVLRAFRSMAGVLRDGGLLILTAVPTDRQWREKPRFWLGASTHTTSRVFAVDYLERSARFHILDIFHGEGQHELKVWSAELNLLLRDDQERLLDAAGFQAVNFYGGFDFEPYDRETSRKLIAVARK